MYLQQNRFRISYETPHEAQNTANDLILTWGNIRGNQFRKALNKQGEIRVTRSVFQMVISESWHCVWRYGLYLRCSEIHVRNYLKKRFNTSWMNPIVCLETMLHCQLLFHSQQTPRVLLSYTNVDFPNEKASPLQTPMKHTMYLLIRHTGVYTL